MDKQINFEDNIFILNVRIRMLIDLLRLDVDPGLFLEQTVDDLIFIDYALSSLLRNLAANRRFIDREEELDKLADLQWHFDKLLTGAGSRFPAIGDRLAECKKNSEYRHQNIAEIRSPGEQAASEPVVSSSELSELLRGL
ncbi:MAG TPA: hypothetical protein DEQ14_09785 [Treponema sp.]|nr:hypothetical protein [Treponema sp.]